MSMNFLMILVIFFFSTYPLNQNQEQVVKNLKKTCLQNPDSIEAWTNLGIFFLQNNYIQDAFDAYKKALELDEKNINTWFHLANCYLSNDEPETAENIYTLILKASHCQEMVWHNLAYAFKRQNKYLEALEAFKYSIRYALEDPGNHLSYALMQLTLGNYEVGFAEYEWRWCTALKKLVFNHIPLWNGENLAGKTLLVTAEQGFGDSFQFMRYLKVLHEQGVSIIFRAQKPVIPLAKLCPYITEVLYKEEPFLGTADAHISLMSIPYIMKTTVETIPQEGQYLFTHTERDTYWQTKIGTDQAVNIGICFKGNDLFATANFQTTLSKKSISMELLKELTDIPNTKWFCLQRNTDIQECKDNLALTFFDDSFDSTHGSFIDTASVMKCLDLVITVDTATAHLAGGLCVSTIVLLPFVADWRWLINRTDSPWYETLYLLRQTRLNDWSTVISPLKIIIQEWLCKKGFSDAV